MVITRFAPSPTGHLHIGGLRTALYSYLHARTKGGKFLLRIEDTDTQRNSKEALDGILEAFKWVGLEYDSPMLFQSQRIEIYREYANKLVESGKAYYCYLSKEELSEMRERNRDTNHTNFSRKYRDFNGEAPKDIKPCIRIKAPLDGNISFDDGVKGLISFNANEIDDFVILRSDGTPTYNFVVAIDDALSNVTDIIRGDDHISNTPKQLIVYDALNFKIPTFYHIPMICNESGKKLSKRDGALSVLEYKEAGILPQALLNFLFKLGYGFGDKEIFSINEMKECFEAHNINSNASGCNFSKLYWLNAEYIKAMDNKDLCKTLNMQILNNISPNACNILLNEVKMRVNNLVDMKESIKKILYAPVLREKQDTIENCATYDMSFYNKLFHDEMKTLLIESLKKFQTDAMESNDFTNTQNAKDIIQAFSNRLSFKAGIFMQTLRLALLGQKGGIDIAACICIIGKKETIDRINSLINIAEKS